MLSDFDLDVLDSCGADSTEWRRPRKTLAIDVMRRLKTTKAEYKQLTVGRVASAIKRVCVTYGALAMFDVDVLEACELVLPEHRKTAMVRPIEITRRLRMSNPVYAQLTVTSVATSIKRIFPIHKNKRINSKYLKISKATAREHRERVAIRPLADARTAAIGRAVAAASEMQMICPPTRAKARHAWEAATTNIKWRRVLLHVEDVEGDMLRIAIPQWNVDRAIHIPLAALPAELAATALRGSWLLAQASIAATDVSHFRMRGFEQAPNADPDDGLA